MKDTRQQLESALTALDCMEAASGSNAKKMILKQCEDNTVLRDLCFACYGGDKFNAYPSIQFDDAEAQNPPFKDGKAAVYRYEKFKKMLIELRDRTLSGDAAVAVIDQFLDSCEYTEKKWYRRVLEHDLKVGLASSFSKLWDFKILTLEGTARPESDIIFPGVMRCEKEERHIAKWDPKKGILVEPKMDGLRLLFVWAGGDKWSFFSRQGKSERYNQNLKHIGEALVTAMKRCNMTSGSVDGEILGVGWNDTLSIKRKTVTAEDQAEIDQVNFHIFDHLMSTNGRDDRAQNARRKSLEQIALYAPEGAKIILVTQFHVDTLEDARPLFRKFVSQKYEGAILKNPDAPYNGERNKASKNWVKMKPLDTQDVRVVGMYEGRERTKNEGVMGGFNVTNMAGEEFNVGGGFTDEQRKEYWEKGVKAFVGKWMEIEYQKDDVAKGRFSVFIRWREDLE